MARFDVYRGAGGAGWLLDVQSVHLDHLPTRMVVPLLEETAALPAIRDLTPILRLDDAQLAIMTHYMAAVPKSGLGRPVGNLLGQADDITRALDILLTGF
jgi:toxin CcdB